MAMTIDEGKTPGQKQQPQGNMADAFARAQSAQGQQPKQNPGQQQGQGYQRRGSSLAAALNGGRASLGIVRTSGDLLRLQTRFESIIKQINEADASFEYKLLSLDMQTDPMLSVSVLVWTQHQRGIFNRVAYRAFVIASSLGELAPRTEMFQNQGQMELLRVPCQAYDERMADIVRKRVEEMYPGKPLIDCDYYTVPVDFDYAEVEEDRRGLDTDHVYALASYTDANLVNILDMGTEYYNVLDLSKVGNDNTLQVKPRFGDEDYIGVSGIPVRGNVHVSLTSIHGGQNNEAPREDELTRAIGYMDVAWVGRPQVQQFYNMQNQQPMQPWVPHFIMTEFWTGNSQNIETYNLALVAAHVLRQNLAWMQAFRTRERSRETLHDIGGLSVLANPMNDPTGFGKVEDTRNHDFNVDVYIESMIRPELIMSVDLPVGRTLSSFTTLIGDAAGNDPKAQAILIDALDQLTGKMYSRKCAELNVNKNLFIDSGIVLPEGYFIDENSQKRDIRHIDLIAYSKLVGTQNQQQLIRFVNCLQQNNMQVAERLASLRKMFVGVLGENNVTFTGITRRLNINAKAMGALAECVGALTGGIRPVLPSMDQNSLSMQGMAGLDIMTLQGSVGNSMFNNNPLGGGNNSYNNLGHIGSTGRWF